MGSASRAPRDLLSGISGLLVREAATRDAVQDVVPGVVVEPDTVAQVSSVMRVASQQDLGVVPRGTGSKLDWTDPPRSVDVILDLGRLQGVVDHAAGDMVVVARAGTRLAKLQETLASTRQWLALDPAEADATLGGLVATNAAGPRQLVYGRPRDLLIGIAVVLPDGSVARSGGRVVKNVAGYDLGKLYAGSLGTLGVIVEVTFRLHPIPEASERFEFEIGSEAEAQRAAAEIGGSQLEPSSVTIRWSPHGTTRIIVGLCGGAAGERERGSELSKRVASQGGLRVAAREDGARRSADCVLRLGFRPADLAHVLARVREEVGRSEVECDVECGALLGVADVHLEGATGALRRVVDGLRGGLGADANVLLRKAPPQLKRELGSFGRLGSPEELLRRVKREFDPTGVLSPGRVPWA